MARLASAFERDFCFVVLATASRGNFKSAADYLSSLDLKFLHNIQIHLKILRLDFLRSNLKINLQISALNFTRRDLHLENPNLLYSNLTKKPATLCVSKAMSPHLTCSGVGEGLGEGLSPTVTSAKREVKEGDAS